MDFDKEYNRIRPYKDQETPEAIKRILKDESFGHMIAYLYGANNKDKVLKEIAEVKSILEFQSLFSHYAVREVVRKTATGLTLSGLEELDTSKGYLFIANHRDIVLDSAIMQILLHENKHKTSQITFGSNLMTSDFIVDIGKLNKMFTFNRGGSRIQMYKDAVLHSQYIKKVITEENESIWIAQRDGRTKDGDDRTQVSLIKMLTMGKDNPYEALKELNIVPVTISYEYEPCDFQKIKERHDSKTGQYIKQVGEDMESVLRGITGYKGKIHMAFGELLNPIIEECELKKFDLNELAEKIANSIDQQVHQNFELRPINYIAHDIINKQNKYLDKEYNKQEVLDFEAYIEGKIKERSEDKSEFKDMFLSMYAMPLINKLNAQN